MYFFTQASLLAVVALAARSLAQCPGQTNAYPLTVAAGLNATLVASTGIKAPLTLVFDPLGNLLVVNGNGGGVSVLNLTPEGCVASSKVLINDPLLTYGLALSADGKLLFASSSDKAWVWKYDAATGTVTDKKWVVRYMNNDNALQARPLFISRHNPDRIFIGRASEGQQGSQNRWSGRGSISIFSITDILDVIADFNFDGINMAAGLRESLGLAEHPKTGGIWTVDKASDPAMRHGVDVSANNGGDKLNSHGTLADYPNTRYGKRFGYPVCRAVWEPAVLANSIMEVGKQFATDNPNYPTELDVEDSNCNSLNVGPRLTFPPRVSPVDIRFNKDGSAAYISFHGSAAAGEPQGYGVVKVQFGADGQPIEPATSKTSWKPVLTNADATKCPSGCFRPGGMAFDAKGRLFVASDTTDQIFMISGDL